MPLKVTGDRHSTGLSDNSDGVRIPTAVPPRLGKEDLLKRREVLGMMVSGNSSASFGLPAKPTLGAALLVKSPHSETAFCPTVITTGPDSLARASMVECGF